MSFLRKVSIVLLACLAVAVTFRYLSASYRIAFGHQGCLPYKVFLVEKNVMPRIGDYVCFRGTKVPFYGPGIRLIKRVAGSPGDRVTVMPAAGEYREFDINGMTRRFRVRAHVYLVRADGSQSEYTAFEHGTDGRVLPFVFSEYPARKNEGDNRIKGYFVAGLDPRSYDSRYWGDIDESVIIGRALPLL